MQFCFCQCITLKWTVCTELEIRWFYSNVYVPISNWRKQISHWKPLLKFKLLRTKYTNAAIKTAYCYVFNSDVLFCEGCWQNSVTVETCSGLFHLQLSILFALYQPDTRTGHILLYIILIMKLFPLQLPMLWQFPPVQFSSCTRIRYMTTLFHRSVPSSTAITLNIEQYPVYVVHDFVSIKTLCIYIHTHIYTQS